MIPATTTHLRHFGLRVDPFSLTADPDVLYLSPAHGEALAALRLGVSGRNGVTVLTGEVGTGKTMLAHALLRSLGDDTATAYVANTGAGFDGVMRLALMDFGAPSASPSRFDQLCALNDLLARCAETGRSAVLVVDEAHNLDVECFEQLRLLTNFETFTAKLLQIVLIGQPELEARLQTPALRALTDRVTVHCRLVPLAWRESRAYLDHRLARAGGSSRVFQSDARDLLLQAAQGLPRRINMLCRNALLFAYSRREVRVTKATAHAAIAARAALMGPATPAPAVDGHIARPRRGAVAALCIAAAGVAGSLWAAHLSWPEGGAQAAPSPQVAVAAAADSGPRAEPASQALSDEPAAAGRLAALRVDEVERAADGAAAPVPSDAAVPALGPEEPAPLRRDEPESAADRAAPVTRDREATELASAVATVAGSGEQRVRVEPGQTLESLARSVYGVVDANIVRHIQAANPHVVNPDHILAGDVLRFPERRADDDGNAGQEEHTP